MILAASTSGCLDLTTIPGTVSVGCASNAVPANTSTALSTVSSATPSVTSPGREHFSDVRWRAVGDDGSVVDHADVGQVLGHLVNVVGGDEEGSTGLTACRLYRLPQRQACCGGQAQGGLVEQDDRWLIDEC